MHLGIDIGGTTVGLGLVRDGAIVRREVSSSFLHQASLEETLEYLASLIDNILTPEVESIGIGVPSVVDTVKGIVYDAANIPSWKECHLKEFLENRFKLPVFVNNDSNCFALGAYCKVKDLAPEILLGVTLGTGVGVGVTHFGKLLTGAHTGVGEISCAPYLEGQYEDYCSSKFFRSKGLIPKEVYERACEGDAESAGMYDEFAGHLGKFLALVMYAYDPEVIVLGGGLANAFEMFKDKMWAALRSNFVYGGALSDLKIIACPDGDLAILGAAMLS